MGARNFSFYPLSIFKFISLPTNFSGPFTLKLILSYAIICLLTLFLYHLFDTISFGHPFVLRYHYDLESVKCLLNETKHFSKKLNKLVSVEARGAPLTPIY